MSLPLLPFYTVNAFAPTPHTGNQAAVVLFPSPSDPRAEIDEYMRLVARDFNYAETAFLVPLSTEGPVPRYGLRWFTPEVEVPLCGHATLASALVVFGLFPSASSVEFDTRFSGTLTATLESGGGIAISLPMATLDAVSKIDKTTLPIDQASIIDVATFSWSVDPSIVVELDPKFPLKEFKMDIPAIKKAVPSLTILTQQVPAESDKALRINSRVFAPHVGIDEDTVTGVAHAVLTRYYLDGSATSRLPAHLGSQPELDALQVSPRGGGMKCTKVGDRAKLTGTAWETGRGTLSAFDLKYYQK